MATPRTSNAFARVVAVVALSAAFCASAPAQAADDGGSLFGPGALDDKPKGLSLQDDTDDRPEGLQCDLPFQVSTVELAGIERVDKQTVINQVRVHSGTPFDPGLIAEDVKRIFAMGLFDDVRVGVRPALEWKKGVQCLVVVRYQVLERPSIAAVQIDGNDAQSDEDVMKVVDLRVNNLYSPADCANNVNKIKDLYAEEGYFLATVTYRTESLPNNQVKVIFDVQERSEVKVRHIDLLGNDGVPDADIKAVLRTQEGSALGAISKSGNFKREQLEYDMQVMQYLYLTRGYIQAKIDEPIVSLSPDMKYITIAIRVHEGPQFKVGKVKVTGDSVEPAEKLLPLLQLKEGEIFNYEYVQKDGQKITGAQKNFGFAHATVSNESVPDAEKKTVDWSYHVQRGKKVYFGQIVMQGGGSTRDKVIRREMVIIEGDLYSEDKIKMSQARIQRLGYFDKVDIKTRATAIPQVLDVVVEVKERTTGTFQVGMGFSSVDNFITTAQISKDNFLGRGQRFSINGQISSIRTMFQASFFEPYLFDTNVTLSVDLLRYDQLYTDFTRRSKGATLSMGYRLSDNILVEGSYNVEQATTTPGGLSGKTDVPATSLFGQGITSSLRGTLSYDSRDDRMFPTTGWFASVTSEFALPQLGSDFDFQRFSTRVRRYFPLPLEGVLKFNLVGGYINAAEGTRIPLFERYFIGGIYNIRGFARNSLGPTIQIPSSSDPGGSMSAFHNGGTKQLYLNNEIEVPVLKAPMNLRALLFFDIGNAYGEGQPIALNTMRQAFGWGVRWFSPVGPLRFEWGVPIAPLPGEQPLVFEFTIGNSF